MEPCETSIFSEQDAVIFVMYQVTMATGSLVKAPYILALVAHI